MKKSEIRLELIKLVYKPHETAANAIATAKTLEEYVIVEPEAPATVEAKPVPQEVTPELKAANAKPPGGKKSDNADIFR